MINRENDAALGVPVGRYVHAAQHDRVLNLSGLTAWDADAQGGSSGDPAHAPLSQIEIIARRERDAGVAAEGDLVRHAARRAAEVSIVLEARPAVG